MSWRIIEGDARQRLCELPERSVQTCITSPPYFRLRDYGVAGQLGLEDTVDEYVQRLVGIFREVRRVLRDDGTMWLNLGDSYAGSWAAQGHRATPAMLATREIANHPKFASRTGAIRAAGAKPKDLLGIPWTLALALRADGWYLRRDIIWSKPAPKPESARDRPTTSHEYVFLLSKQPRYFYDGDAIREPSVSLDPSHSSYRPSAVALANATGRREFAGKHARSPKVVSHAGRSKRSVWTIATRPFKGAHFATFPPGLVEPMVLAGTAPHACAACGTPARRSRGELRLDPSRPHARRALELARRAGLSDAHLDALRAVGLADGRELAHRSCATTPDLKPLAAVAKRALGSYAREFLMGIRTPGDWTADCEHNDLTGQCVVLDPFSGAATTGLVAIRNGRSFIGIELNPAYAQLGRDRILSDAPQKDRRVPRRADAAHVQLTLGGCDGEAHAT